MVSSIAAILLAFQLSAGGASPDPLPDTYLDPAARHLVEQARTRRSSVEGRIQQYTTTARGRVSVGMRALRRDRTIYVCEAVSRINWTRGDTVRVDLLGAREATPMFSEKVQAGDGDCGGGMFDPTADRLAFALGGGMSAEDSSFLRHPLADASDRDYRFRSGETTTMRLADGTTVRLLELQVLPRRNEPFLVRGSLWLEDRSYAVVRAVLRMARPFDYDRDAHRLQDDDEDDDDVPGILKPLRAELRFMSIEYGLWDEQWWLPRLVAFEGHAEAARLLSVPVRLERVYDAYQVTPYAAGVAVPALPELPPDSVCAGIRNDEEAEDSGDDGAAESTSERDATNGRWVSCQCTGDRCQVVVTQASTDSAGLISSELLPPSIHSEGNVLVLDREMEELLSRIGNLPAAPWQLAPITWRTGLQGFDLVRYNRVEGLSVGAAANLDLGRATVDGIVRIGVADLAPNFELAASRSTVLSTQRIGVYRRLDEVGPGQGALGFGGSLAALLLGRDHGDYYRSWGAEVARDPLGQDGLSWRLFGELQRSAEKETDFSLPGAFGDSDFRPNIEAQEADQVGLQLALQHSRGVDPTGWRGSVRGALLGSTGTFSFVQPRLTLRGAAPLPFDLLGGLELNGGTTFGDAPLQSWYFLGGGRTVRGYDGNAARGDTYWNARGEIATPGPGARFVLFGDAGWAGEQEALGGDAALLSAGAGVSFLDGLLRFDVARALREVPGGEGWRVELQVDAGL